MVGRELIREWDGHPQHPKMGGTETMAFTARNSTRPTYRISSYLEYSNVTNELNVLTHTECVLRQPTAQYRPSLSLLTSTRNQQSDAAELPPHILLLHIMRVFNLSPLPSLPVHLQTCCRRRILYPKLLPRVQVTLGD